MFSDGVRQVDDGGVEQNAPQSEPSPAEAPEPTEPMTLTQAAMSSFRELMADETTSGGPFVIADAAIDKLLGEKIAPGLYVAHTAKTARFHLFDTPLDSTIEDIETSQQAFLDCIEKMDLIEGITPSRNALRVMILLFRNFPDLSQEDSSSLKALRNEAGSIDLDAPEDPNWSTKCTIQVGDEKFDFSCELVKVNQLARLTAVLTATDIPREHRGHKYAYRLEVRSSTPKKTEALRRAEHKGRQFLSTLTLSAPIMAATWASAKLLPATLLPTFTSNSFVQGLAEFGADAAPLAAAGVLSYFLFRGGQRQKHS